MAGFLDDMLSSCLTHTLVGLKTSAPESYELTKSGIKTTAELLEGISGALEDDNINAEELDRILSTAKSKGEYRAVISVITSILGHVKAR